MITPALDTVALVESLEAYAYETSFAGVTLNAGTIVNVKQQYANGWSKVEYNGTTGYIKSEFLE